MLITLLYGLWIAYTVGSISIVLFLTSLYFLSKWEKKKHDERIAKVLSENGYEDEGW